MWPAGQAAISGTSLSAQHLLLIDGPDRVGPVLEALFESSDLFRVLGGEVIRLGWSFLKVIKFPLARAQTRRKEYHLAGLIRKREVVASDELPLANHSV